MGSERERPSALKRHQKLWSYSVDAVLHRAWPRRFMLVRILLLVAALSIAGALRAERRLPEDEERRRRGRGRAHHLPCDVQLGLRLPVSCGVAPSISARSGRSWRPTPCMSGRPRGSRTKRQTRQSSTSTPRACRRRGRSSRHHAHRRRPRRRTLGRQRLCQAAAARPPAFNARFWSTLSSTNCTA